MEVYRSDLSDILRILRESERIDIGDAPAECDLFLCTLGFEDRTHTLVTLFSEADALKRASVLLVAYPTNPEENAANLQYFEKAARNSIGFHSISYSRREYSNALSECLARLIGGRPGARVIFDISSCASYALYPTMRELMKLDIDLTVVYTEAETYYPTIDEWNEVAKAARSENALFAEAFENASFQTIGVDDVYPSPIFAEMNPGNRPTLLIAVPNFSASRMQTIITRDQEINKTPGERIHWLIGEPLKAENQWRVDAVKITNNLADVDHARVGYVSTLHYKEILKSLEDIWIENRHDYHIAIGTLGSKMQHLGTFFFMYLHKDIGLWLAEPKRFQAARFSSGESLSWRIPLGSTTTLNEALDRYMAFAWRYQRT